MIHKQQIFNLLERGLHQLVGVGEALVLEKSI